MELTLRELELLIMPNNAQKKKKNKKCQQMLDILQKYVFEMQGNYMLPMTYQQQLKKTILSN